MHALALHVGAGVLPQLQRLGVVAEDDADLFQHRVGVLLDEGEALLVEHLVDLDLAADVGELLAGAAARARRAPRRRAAARSPRARLPPVDSASTARFSFMAVFPESIVAALPRPVADRSPAG